ncbi:hypothetical protein DEAC_c24330 [Desulfosporosinus acididurans]|uniref:Uncharacterized protein n=1 Tax=Desulfosporosinus acididurans TaxID=476652 RepID=A0A0J1FS25_9FIRM|nr:hypothetical protein [Desulfosporosinus acididurans]KLU65803.1 hypothetical protein DEAC_c24330 [Desulfosporosinus acididurans]
MDEKRIFTIGLKLVGAMNIISGLVNFISFIPVIINVLGGPMPSRVVAMPNQIVINLIQMIGPIFQIVAGTYLLKDGQAVVNFAYKIKSKLDE